VKHVDEERAVFRRLNPQQSLFQPCIILPDSLKQKLGDSWADVFRSEALPMIPEHEFAHLYHAETGRPNFPVALLIALSIIKELLGLTDTLLIQAFHFNLIVLHALGLEVGELTLAPRTLYYFRFASSPKRSSIGCSCGPMSNGSIPPTSPRTWPTSAAWG
jgi:hypothetical protein